MPSRSWPNPRIGPSELLLEEGALPYDWDATTGLSERFIPGRPGGMHTVTGLAHDENSRVAYDSAINERLLVGWGSTRGAIEEAVDRARDAGLSVSSAHLTFLSPLQPGLKELFGRFRKVMTVEINYSDKKGDPFVNEENRRRGQLSTLLRAATLVDVDCWTRVLGEPLRPGAIVRAIEENLPSRTDGGAA